MCPVRAYGGYSDAGPSVQFKMINFSNTELKALPHLGDQRTYQRALLLERMHVPEQEVELQRRYVRGFSLSSKVSMTSPVRMSE